MRQDRYLSNMAKRQRFQRLNSDFCTATGVRVSSQTVRNRLHTANLRAYRSAVRTILTLRHRTACLQCARDHVELTTESRFCVDFHDGRRRVWRMLGERYAELLCN